ncbi:hypothetical protein JCM15519_11230 [Fundidesulfovibrio butyratiphilus]
MERRNKESLEERVARVLKDPVFLTAYDPVWPARFQECKSRLLRWLPPGLVLRVEHYGSTSVPGLAAKPVIDMLVEVASAEEAWRVAEPILTARGCDGFWRSELGDDKPPFYAWFIGRDAAGVRVCHIHMVPGQSRLWEGLVFRDILRANPATAQAYEQLKRALARDFPHDRESYTHGKTAFVRGVLDASGAGVGGEGN